MFLFITAYFQRLLLPTSLLRVIRFPLENRIELFTTCLFLLLCRTMEMIIVTDDWFLDGWYAAMGLVAYNGNKRRLLFHDIPTYRSLSQAKLLSL